MLTKTIKISGRDVTFKSSAAIPRLYRMKFRRDIFRDLTKLEGSFKEKQDNGTEFTVDNLEIFENVAYVMALHGDPKNTPKNIDDWLEQFEMFSIYEVLPELLELWGENLFTDVPQGKNVVAPQES